jgi:integral membrane protein (TIGR01906 family)
LGLFRALIIAAFVAAIPLALITTNVRVAISEQRIYDYSVREYGASDVSGIPESELIRSNGEIKRYLTHENTGDLVIEVINERGATVVPLFSARETAHMADVRDLVQWVFVLQIAAVLTVLTLAVVMIVMWPVRVLATAALCGAILTGVLLGTAGIVAASGFDSAWTEFHVIAFTNDLWQLDPSRDHLIQMFPEAFWRDVTALIVAATLVEALIMASASAAYLVISSRPEYVPLGAFPAPEIAGRVGQSRSKLAAAKPRHIFR